MQKRIIMLGPDMNGRGGISSVVKGYLDSGIIKRLNISYYSLHQGKAGIVKVLRYFISLTNIVISVPNFDVVHVHTASWWSFRKLFPVIFVAKKMKKKIIIHLHGGEFDVYFKKVNLMEQSLIKYGFKQADKVAVLSEEWIKRASLFCDPRKILIIPNSVRVDEEKTAMLRKKPDKPRMVLFMGEISPLKGVYDLLDAIKILNPDKDGLVVYLCGNGEVDKAKEYSLKLGLENIVKIPGWINGQHKQGLLEDAYLYVLPSYVEGLPMSILEAMSKSTPVISTKVGGIPDVVTDGHDGFLVEVHNPEMLADRIRQLLSDTDLWSSLSRNAFKTIKDRFSIDETEERLRGLYNFESLN